MRQQNNIYDINNHKNEFFETSEWIRDKMYEMIPKTVHTILDPCAGDLGLEDFSKNYEYTLYDIENRNDKLTKICDFLKLPYNGERYDCVVVNPPFAFTNEFVKKCFLYSNDVFLIAPIKTTLGDFGDYIQNMYLNWKISYQCFKVLTSIGIFHLHIDDFFNTHLINPNKFLLQRLDEKNTIKSLNWHFINHHIENKPFIVHLITKGRILRNEILVNDSDIHDAGDESVFIATMTSANKKTKKGDLIKRNILYFNTIDDAKKYQKWFNDNDEYIREYCYEYGSNLLGLNEIPKPIII